MSRMLPELREARVLAPFVTSVVVINFCSYTGCEIPLISVTFEGERRAVRGDRFPSGSINLAIASEGFSANSSDTGGR